MHERKRWLSGESVGSWESFKVNASALSMAAVVAFGAAAMTGTGPVRAAVPPALAASGATSAQTNVPKSTEGFVRLPGHVLPAIDKASRWFTGGVKSRDLNLTLVMRRDDQAGFESYLEDIYDPQSANYHRFLTAAQLADRFGPSRESYDGVVKYLKSRGFKVLEDSKDRMTLTVSGSRAKAQNAFDVSIQNYRIGKTRFYANSGEPGLPASLAAHVQDITGLNNFAKPQHGYAIAYVFCASVFILLFLAVAVAFPVAAVPAFIASIAGLAACWIAVTNAYNADHKPQTTPVNFFGTNQNGTSDPNPYQRPPVLQPGGFHSYMSQGIKLPGEARRHVALAQMSAANSAPIALTGAGQTIGLLEFASFTRSDVAGYLGLIGASSQIDNLSEVQINGGASVNDSTNEVLLDIDAVMSIATAAKVVVYDAPFDGRTTSYATLFNAMIDGGVTIISNSWSSCEDQVSQADAQGVDAVLQTAAAAGISVFNGTGDAGSTCLDGSVNTIGVPADSPNATAVGGSSLNLGSAFNYNGETWWNGSNSTPVTGQGGYGVSRYFAAPSYQAGLNSSAMRSIPDVVINADPALGIPICQASAGGCPGSLIYGGTSLATPEWAAFTALFNQAQGSQGNIGAFNPLLYSAANTQGFHNAASMGSDFAHVGLGSPNLDHLALVLTGATVGAPDASLSSTQIWLPFSVLNGASPKNVAGLANLGVPSDGTTQGQIVVALRDANGHALSGKTVTLASDNGNVTISSPSQVTSADNGVAIFTATTTTPGIANFTAVDTTDGFTLPAAAMTFAVPPAASGGITANPSTVAADGQTAATIVVTLKDSLNRPTPGKTVSISDANAHAVITGPTPSVTDANGQIQFSATDQVAETVTFTAIDVTDANLPIPGNATVTYSNATSTACNVGVPPVAAAGYTITPYITGLPATPDLYYAGVNFYCEGGNNPAFTSAGTVLVSDGDIGSIYQLGLAGGAASSSNLLATLTPALSQLIYGKDGSVYAALSGAGGSIIQINPATGAQLRVVASNLTCPGNPAIDPLSGDLFFDDPCTGGGLDDPTIYRIIDPANSNASLPTSVVPYATLPATPNGGLAFAPNGTLYAVTGYAVNTSSANAQVEVVSGTNAATISVTPVTGVMSSYQLAIGVTNADGSAQSLIVQLGTTLSEVPIANPSAATVLATVSPGIGVTGPDGCLYSANYDTVYRLANSNGGCSFAPTSPAPSIKLTPTAVAPNPAQGSSQTFTATLQNVATAANVPVFFSVAGANPQVNLVYSNGAGVATLSYTAAQAGKDAVTATSTSNGTALTSNTVNVTWTAGQHVTFLTLNASPQGGMVNIPVNVVASLADVSASPAAALAGQTVNFSLGNSTCSATTNSAGIATCPLTPSQGGTGTLTAQFAGSSTLVASTASTAFNVLLAQTPAPTVTLAVNPTNVAAGTAATLTWSSANATACSASGSWSGTEATSGTQAVTPPSTGSYSYTLTCTGNGGSGSATAVLSATLVTVTVTAHSGGGAMTWPWLLMLGSLVLLRVRTFKRVAGLGILLLLVMGSGLTRADERSVETTTGGPPMAWLDPFYVGIRFGSMTTHLNSGYVETGLAADGYPGVQAITGSSEPAGTVYVGYEVAPHADVEFGYTHRSANVATLNGIVASAASIPPLLQDTAALIRGYGNVFSLSFRPRIEFAPNFMLDARIGGFYWDTKLTAQTSGYRFDDTHDGGGVTVGAGVAYRVWRGLEFGVGADFFRGFPHNIGTLYSGTLEWRFGPR